MIFLLTLTALYGLGMIMASLYLVWGREAFQLNQLFVEPVYFVSGLNFPVMSLGLIGAMAHRDDPAGGRSRCDAPARLRRLVVPGRHAIRSRWRPSILVAMSVGFTLAARYTLAALERMARREGRLSIRWQ